MSASDSSEPTPAPSTPPHQWTSVGAKDTPPADEGLPQDEPLSPEVLEDEALRGDFMLRWAVVLLAILLGCTEIGDTQTLVHVKTGQYLFSHGVLPPRTDVFSSTAADRPWINLAWLFDLTLAGVFAIGGPIALTVFKAILSGVTFWLVVNSGLRGISSWWGSVCAAMALLVAHVQFSALPDLVTLLGVALVFYLVQRWSSGELRSLWALPIVFLFWSNMDPRMFFGFALLLLYAVGETLGQWMGRATLTRAEQRSHLWMVVAASAVATLVNPFGWNALLAPLPLYKVEYPALREYYATAQSYGELQYRSLLDAAIWKRPNHVSVTTLVLAAAALVSIGLNHRRFAWSHVLLILGAGALALTTSREAPPAAVIFAMVAGWNAQQWYRATFRQAYSVETAEVLFSRGGRAVTVLGLATFAFLVVSGRLPMPNAVRAGFGWHPTLALSIDGLRDELGDLYDNRPFNFLLQQGDVFIWLDRQPFIDHRLAIYKGPGDADLLAEHNRTRRALRSNRRDDPGSGQRVVWQKSFDKYDITQAVPRLAGASPDYVTTRDLLTNPDFQLVKLGSSSAVFCRRDKPADYRHSADSPKLSEYLATHRVNFMAAAFQTPLKEDAKKVTFFRDWPASTGAYESVLLKARQNVPASLQEAQHYHMLIQQAAGGQIGLPPDVAAALAHLVIRKANEGLQQNPNHAGGYRMLGSAYDFLGLLENQLSGPNRSVASSRRVLQTLQAYGQSLLLDADQPEIHLRLVDIYAGQNKADLALFHLDALDAALKKAQAQKEDDESAGLPARYTELRAKLQQVVDDATAAIEQRKKDPERPQAVMLAGMAEQAGCTLMALALLETDPTAVETNPAAILFKASLLVEAGRPWDAAPLFAQIEQYLGDRPSDQDWRTMAAVVRLAQGDHTRSIELIQQELNNVEIQGFMQAAHGLPLVVRPAVWPVVQTHGAISYLYQHPESTAQLRFQIALTHLEAGRQKEGEAALREALLHSPESSLRPLLRFYLLHVSGELIDAEPPSDWIPMTKDAFAPSDDAGAKK